MVEKYIKELLYFNDCVIIPEFGGFVCKYSGAEISIAKNKISPPHKSIAFNDKLTTSDNLLAREIAKGEGISIEEAQGKIKHFVVVLLEELQSNKQFIIEQLGRFSFNLENNIQFEQYLKFNYLIDSFGLPELYFKPIDRTQNQKFIFNTKNQNPMAENIQNDDDELETEDSVEESYEEIDSEEFVGRKREKGPSTSLSVYYVLAILALFFVTGTTYYLNMDKKTYAIGSFNPMAIFGGSNNDSLKENKLLPSEETTVGDNTSETTEEQPIEETPAETGNSNQNYDVVPETVAPSVDLSDAITSQTGRFYLIAGSFKKATKAVSLKDKLLSDGQAPKIIAPSEEGGLLRVSINDFGTYDEAVQKKNELLETYGPDIWVLTY